jgi:hypothetical protein
MGVQAISGEFIRVPDMCIGLKLELILSTTDLHTTDLHTEAPPVRRWVGDERVQGVTE